MSRVLAMEAIRGEQSEGSQGEIRLVRGEDRSRSRRGKAARHCLNPFQCYYFIYYFLPKSVEPTPLKGFLPNTRGDNYKFI